ncbi:MAG: helix-turn-helix domain-containing protein, partial [Acidimicrobiales bacterium]
RRLRTDTRAPQLPRPARRRAGLSQHALAKAAGVPQSMIGAVERGWQDPSVTTLTKMLRGTGWALRLELVADADGQLKPTPDEEDGAHHERA